jgi:hypothetical protein
MTNEPTIDLQGGVPEPTTRGAEARLFWQEVARASLALLSFVLLAVTILIAFGKAGSPGWNDTKELLQLIFPAEVAVLSSATGFYFASRH